MKIACRFPGGSPVPRTEPAGGHHMTGWRLGARLLYPSRASWLVIGISKSDTMSDLMASCWAATWLRTRRDERDRFTHAGKPPATILQEPETDAQPTSQPIEPISTAQKDAEKPIRRSMSPGAGGVRSPCGTGISWVRGTPKASVFNFR